VSARARDIRQRTGQPYQKSAETRTRMSLAQRRRFNAEGTLEEQLLRLTKKTRGCWLWQGRTVHGYGRMGKNYKVHRLAYELWVGPLKDGHHIHHACGTMLCVKPLHLVQMTETEHKDAHRQLH